MNELEHNIESLRAEFESWTGKVIFAYGLERADKISAVLELFDPDFDRSQYITSLDVDTFGYIIKKKCVI